MAIYEYKCESCKHQFEVLQKMTEDPLEDCPECNEKALIKLIGNTNFRLKGTGWYETDFKDSGRRKNLAEF